MSCKPVQNTKRSSIRKASRRKRKGLKNEVKSMQGWMDRVTKPELFVPCEAQNSFQIFASGTAVRRHISYSQPATRLSEATKSLPALLGAFE